MQKRTCSFRDSSGVNPRPLRRGGATGGVGPFWPGRIFGGNGGRVCSIAYAGR